jgi:ParB family chromosome partitioning protein
VTDQAPRPPPAEPRARSAPRGGLGRGLGSLIPRGQFGLQELEVGAIAPNPRQPRTRLDEAALEELAASIRQHGLLQPVVVTRAEQEGRYLLVAGERRWRAAQRAGLQHLPAIVKEAAPLDRLELALVENIQREDLSPLELAAAYRALIDEHGFTQEQVAQRIGKSRVAVANTVRLLQLPSEAHQALASGQISEGHARALLGAPDRAALLRTLEEVTARGLTVRQTEALVRRAGASQAPTEPDAAARPSFAAEQEIAYLEERFRQALGTKVQLVRGRRGGRLVIHFYSDEELEGLYDTIVGRR